MSIERAMTGGVSQESSEPVGIGSVITPIVASREASVTLPPMTATLRQPSLRPEASWRWWSMNRTG